MVDDSEPTPINAIHLSDLSSMEVFDHIANGEAVQTPERVRAIQDLMAFSSRDWAQHPETWALYTAAFGDDSEEQPSPETSLRQAEQVLSDIREALDELPFVLREDLEIAQLFRLAFTAE